MELSKFFVMNLCKIFISYKASPNTMVGRKIVSYICLKSSVYKTELYASVSYLRPGIRAITGRRFEKISVIFSMSSRAS